MKQLQKKLFVFLLIAIILLGSTLTVYAADEVNMSVNDVTVNENAGSASATFTISLSQAHSSDITFSYGTWQGTASALSHDYQDKAGGATIPAGDISATVTVTIIDDTIDEPDEYFSLHISNLSGGVVLTDSSGICTITDDDDPPTINISDAEVTEGNSGTASLLYEVTLSSGSGKYITVLYATQDGTATANDNDYIPKPLTALQFALGETSKKSQ